MREIKFRAWDKRKDGFVFLDLETCFGLGQDIPNGYPDFNWNTVQQFTGLLDKNGKEIYEGDILSFEGTIAECVYKDRCFSFKTVEGTYMTGEKFSEIIGNIYSNPELLSSNQNSNDK